MNWKKLFITFLIVFVVSQVLSYIIHGIILDPTYKRLADLFRPEADMMSMMWVGFVTAILFTFFFVYIFARGYEGKGIMEGVRFGLIIVGFWTIPSIYGQYMVYELPYYLVLQWLLYDLLIMVVLGIVAALIYKPLGTPAESA